MAVVKKSKIQIDVQLDANTLPEKLHWTAEDGGIKNEEAKAVFVSVWDHKKKETLRIDLWTKDMPVDEMKYSIIKCSLPWHPLLSEQPMMKK